MCLIDWWTHLSPEQQAAWFQGIASVLAILVAVAVPAWQRWTERKDKSDEAALAAKALAIAAYPAFRRWGNAMDKVWAFAHPDQIPDNEAPIVGEHLRGALDIPASIAALSDRLHELGSASDPAMHCIFHVERAREYITNDQQGQEVVFDKHSFYGHLWLALNANTQVVNRIEGLFPFNLNELKDPARND